MKEIPLTQGKVALVDDFDFERIAKYKWQYKPHGRTGYAIRSAKKPDGRHTTVRMHREILELSGDSCSEIDHINGDGLNNQRANLRICSRSANSKNRRVNSNSTTGFRGVVKMPNGSYRARIGVDGRRMHLGYFAEKSLAYACYCNAEKRFYGEFAKC